MGETNATTEFSRVGKTLGLSKNGLTTAWLQLQDCRMGPDDPEAIRILLLAAMDERTQAATDTVEQSVAALDGIAREAGAGFREHLNLTKQVILDSYDGLIGHLQAALDDADKNITAALAKADETYKLQAAAAVSTVAEACSSRISNTVDAAVIKAIETHATDSRNKWSVVTLTIAAVCSVLALEGGWYAGRGSVQSNVAAIQSMLGREDGSTWASLMAMNDLRTTLATYCGPASVNVRRLDGGIACTVPLWVSRQGTVGPVPGRSADLHTGVEEVRDALQGRLGTWGLMLAGAAAVLGVIGLARVPAVRRMFGFSTEPTF
jgi:hypothetical protein